jgi:peptide deformylase
MHSRVLLLGDPRLRMKSEAVKDFSDPRFREEVALLKQALQEFRAEIGFGRGIAAPQIGIGKRFIALNLGDGPFVIINPVITGRSEETFTMWDDCMSFPDLLVKVKRHTSISVQYLDEAGREQTWEHMDRATSELLQHEIDHLDGILAVDRALDKESIIYRSVFNENKDYFLDQADSNLR